MVDTYLTVTVFIKPLHVVGLYVLYRLLKFTFPLASKLGYLGMRDMQHLY